MAEETDQLRLAAVSVKLSPSFLAIGFTIVVFAQVQAQFAIRGITECDESENNVRLRDRFVGT